VKNPKKKIGFIDDAVDWTQCSCWSFEVPIEFTFNGLLAQGKMPPELQLDSAQTTRAIAIGGGP